MAKEPTAEERRALAKSGVAMPDGSYYIRNEQELDDAIHAVGRGNADHNNIRKHIIARAKALGLSAKIPDNWNPDGSLKHSFDIDEFLSHHGIKGMKWGVRKDRSSGSSKKSSKSPASEDASRASDAAKKAKKSGTQSLSNKELQDLVTRMNLEQQYSRLAPSNAAKIKKGHNAVKGLLAAGATVNAAIAFAKSPAGQALKSNLAK